MNFYLIISAQSIVARTPSVASRAPRARRPLCLLRRRLPILWGATLAEGAFLYTRFIVRSNIVSRKHSLTFHFPFSIFNSPFNRALVQMLLHHNRKQEADCDVSDCGGDTAVEEEIREAVLFGRLEYSLLEGYLPLER